MAKKIAPLPWKLFVQDCLKGVPQRMRKGEAVLAALDPPYNIGQPYSDYVDRKTQDAYLEYMKPRLETTVEHLHPHGSLWVAINDANVSELDVLCKRDLGLFPRKKVVWYFTFGQNHSGNFTQSHVTWLYYTKHRTKYVFNAGDPAVRIPSARQLVYNDKRANPKGRLPDDTWVLRPTDLEDGFLANHDCWVFSRLCGTFKAKVKGLPNQMPVAMMDRIVRCCSNPGDLVVDIYNGTGTTGEAAVLAGRRYLGFDVSKACIDASEKRLAEAYGRQAAAAKDAASQLRLFDDEKPRKGKAA